MIANALVDDGRVGEVAVGNDDDIALSGAHARRTNAHRFDNTLGHLTADPIAAAKRPIGDQDARAEEIGQGGSRRQRHGKTTDAQAREHVRSRNGEEVRNAKRRHDANRHPQACPQQVDGQLVGGCCGAHRKCHQQRAQQRHAVPGHHRAREGHERACVGHGELPLALRNAQQRRQHPHHQGEYQHGCRQGKPARLRRGHTGNPCQEAASQQRKQARAQYADRNDHQHHEQLPNLDALHPSQQEGRVIAHELAEAKVGCRGNPALRRLNRCRWRQLTSGEVQLGNLLDGLGGEFPRRSSLGAGRRQHDRAVLMTKHRCGIAAAAVVRQGLQAIEVDGLQGAKEVASNQFAVGVAQCFRESTQVERGHRQRFTFAVPVRASHEETAHGVARALQALERLAGRWIRSETCHERLARRHELVGAGHDDVPLARAIAPNRELEDGVRPGLLQLQRENARRLVGGDLPGAEGGEVHDIEQFADSPELHRARLGRGSGVELDGLRCSAPGILVSIACPIGRGDEIDKDITRSRTTQCLRASTGFGAHAAPPSVPVITPRERLSVATQDDDERIGVIAVEPATLKLIARSPRLDARSELRIATSDSVASLLEDEAAATVAPRSVPCTSPSARLSRTAVRERGNRDNAHAEQRKNPQ